VPEENRPMDPNLDKFQIDKRARMKYLLKEIEDRNSVPVKEFLGSIAVSYGIRRATGEEYLHDWMDAGYIIIHNDIIKFLRRPQNPPVPNATHESQEQTR